MTRCLYSAFGLFEACSLCATLTTAACSGRVPCSYMWRMKVGANHCAGLNQPYGFRCSSSPAIGAELQPVPPIRSWL